MALYHSAIGSVGYTIVGSPTIVDGVASGFSADDYLVTTQQFSSISPEKLELQAKFIPTNLNNTYQYIVSYQTTGGLNGGKSGFRINSNNRLQYKVSYYSDGSGDLLVTSSANIQVNSSIIAKGYYIGNGVYGLDVSTDDGNTWVTDTVTIDGSKTIELNSSYGAYIGRTSTAGTDINVFSGSIDLKHTYIKVDGQPWFGICPIEVKKHQIMGPVGYNVVGSPTITDGVASGFGQETYLISSSNLAQQAETECYVRVKIGQSVVTHNVFLGFTGGDYPIRYSPSYKFSFYKKNAGGWTEGITQYAVGNLVDIRYIYKDGYLRLYTKLASADLWAQEMQLAVNSNPIYGAFYFGRNVAVNTQYIAGSIDLNNTYIKVNGKLWFWQPQETKRIVVNGVEVWTKPE